MCQSRLLTLSIPCFRPTGMIVCPSRHHQLNWTSIQSERWLLVQTGHVVQRNTIRVAGLLVHKAQREICQVQSPDCNGLWRAFILLFLVLQMPRIQHLHKVSSSYMAVHWQSHSQKQDDQKLHCQCHCLFILKTDKGLESATNMPWK